MHAPMGGPNPLLQAALAYARLGWSVHPLNGKVPYVGNWPVNAATDPEVIERWWTENPGANVGIACMKSKLIVIDVDTKGEKKGAENLQALFAEYEEFPETYTVQTWSGGLHYYFEAPEGVEIGNKPLTADVDVRGGTRGGKNGGQVVAPPSVISENGQQGAYRVLKNVRPVPLPRWAIEILTKEPERRYVAPQRPSAVPMDRRTGEILEGFQGTPEGLRKRVDVVLQEIRDLPVGGPAAQPVNDRALWLGHFVPHYLHEDETREKLYAAVEPWEDGHEKGFKAIETGLKDGMTDPWVWEAFTGLNARSREERRTPSMDGAGAKYFARVDGDRTFLAASLATDVLKMGPLAAGIDSLMWEYRGGVWMPSKDVARHRAAILLGEQYRRSYAVNAEDIVRSRVLEITCEPTPEVINFRNGLYYWQTDTLSDHSPDVLSTVQLPVDWDPTATCPEFDTFLEQVVHADAIDMVWELIGYLMYSGNPLHKAVMLVGTGRNGKGTFLRTVESVLGKQNITSASLVDLVNTRFTTASLFGKIANIAGDIDGTYLENTATFKAITGQDMISAEHKGRDRFDFTPWAVPVFSANKIPGSADTTVGYLSRWIVLHFPNDFTGREDRTLDARLQTKAELAGIAVKAVAALKRLMARHDFLLPPSAQEAREEFIRRVDQVRTWISECTAPDATSRIPRTALYAVYRNWAARDGHGALKATEFYDRLEAAGVRPVTVRGTRSFAGIRVTDTAEGMGRPR